MACVTPILQERVSGVQRRIEATEAKIAAAEREAVFYRRVVDFVHDNPPDDPTHLAHIDKVSYCSHTRCCSLMLGTCASGVVVLLIVRNLCTENICGLWLCLVCKRRCC